MIKYRWKVQPKPTGRFSAFEHRGWPEALAGDQDTIIAHISCDDDYSPHAVKYGTHKPLTIRVRCAREATKEDPCKWQWRKLKGEYVMLAEAKLAFARFMEQHPDHDFALENNNH